MSEKTTTEKQQSQNMPRKHNNEKTQKVSIVKDSF